MMEADPVMTYQMAKMLAQPVTAFVVGYLLAVIAHV